MQRKKTVEEPLRWDDVRLFLALCRATTVGAAARQLQVDASTVSRRLVVLERTLNTKLFDRSRDGITQTKAAEDLTPVAEEMEEVMMRFERAADGLEREVVGSVRMTCPPDVAEVVVTPLLPELLARHPGLRIELHPGEALLDLTRREADLALRTVRPMRGDLLVARVTTARWVVVASPALAERLGTLRAWSDAPWISWTARLASVPPARWFAEHVRGVEPLLRSDSLRVQLAAAAGGLGVALIPEPSVAHFGLVPVKLTQKLRKDTASWPADELFLVTHRALRDVPRVRVVWELLAERIGPLVAKSRLPAPR